MSEHKEPIPSMIYNASVGGHVTNSQQIIDENENKEQSKINAEVKQILGQGGSVDARIDQAKTDIIGGASSNGNTLKKIEDRVSPLESAVGTGGSVDSRISAAVATETTRAQAAEADRYTKSETYTKEEVHNLITTPSQEYVSVIATAQTTAVTDVLPATGEADTIYRVGNWDGSQYDESLYTEYAWNGSAYVPLSVKSQIGEVYDISLNHAGATYADLAAALGTDGANIPQSLQKGGMSVKYVQSSDNKYVQYRLMATSFSTDTTQWQGVDDEPTVGSVNLVKSSSVYPITIPNKKMYTISVFANNSEFTSQKYIQSFEIGDVIRLIITENTAVFDDSDYIGKKIQLTLWNEGSVVQRIVVKLKQEIIVECPVQADSFSFYFYRQSVGGYYDILLGINEEYAIKAIELDKFKTEQKINRYLLGDVTSFAFPAGLVDTNSGNNKRSVNINIGDIVRIYLEDSEGSPITSINQVKADFYYQGTRVKREDISYGKNNIIISTVQADEIGFYITATSGQGYIRALVGINEASMLQPLLPYRLSLPLGDITTYTFLTGGNIVETFSANNKQSFNVNIGDVIRIFLLDIDSAIVEALDVKADFYYQGNRVARKNITIGVNNVFSSSVQADEIGFYIYKTKSNKYIRALVGINEYAIQETETLKEAPFKNIEYAFAAKKRMLTYSEQTQLGLTPSQFINNISSFLQLVHFTDVHGDWKRVKRAIHIANKLGGVLIDSGDTVQVSGGESTDVYNSYINELDNSYIHAIGNHDSWGILTNEGLYEKYIEPYATTFGWTLPQGVENPTFFYKDDSDFKIRYIILNQWVKYNNVSYGRSYYGQEQIDFFISVLSSVPQGYGVIVVMHSPDKGLSMSDGYSKFWQNVVYNGRGWSGGVTPVSPIIDAFISKSSISMTVTSSEETLSLVADFSSVASNEFICYITGHTHQDSICYVPETNNLQLMLNCTTANLNYSAAENGLAELGDLGKVADTETQDAVNVYTIDREHKEIKVVRIGCDLPFNFSEKRDYMIIPYIN